MVDVAAEDSAADTTGGVAWDMIWTSDWCYYTVEDGLASKTVCIEEPTPAEGEGDATWDMDMADEAGSEGGFRLPEIVFTTGDEAEIEQWEAEREEEYMSIE